MKIKVLISFVGYDAEGKKWRVSEGDELELPAGVDWLEKGLVEEVETEAEVKIKATRKGKTKKTQEELF